MWKRRRRTSTGEAIRPLRVALFTHSFPPNLGGVETVTKALAEGLAQDHDFDVDVITLATTRSVVEAPEGYYVYRSPSVRTVYAIARTADALVFHAPMLKYAWVSLVARKPRLSVVHGRLRDLFYDGLPASASRLARAKFEAVTAARICFLRSSDELIAVSRSVSEETGHRARVIHNGIDTSVFNVTKIDRPSTRIAFAGRLSPEKGLETLLKAMAKAKHVGTSFSLDVMGDGGSRHELETITRELGLSGAVTFHGAVTPTELARLFNECSIACVPSLWQEAFGVIALEAQACGCVVVASNRGGLPEALGGAGVLVPAGDSDVLAESLIDLVGDPAEMARLQLVSRDNVANHSQGRMVSEHARAIMDAIGAD